MVSNNHIGDLVENAIEKTITHSLDVMTMRLSNSTIKWSNLEIQNKSDFLKGQLLAEIIQDFTNNFSMVYAKKPSPTEYLDAYRIVMNRANEIKKAINDIEIDE